LQITLVSVYTVSYETNRRREKLRKKSRFLRVVIMLLTLSAFLFSALSSYAAQGRLKVVASIAPLADFARQVGKDKVDVLLLLPPGASPHTYEPVPRTVQEISKAKIFIEIGAGLEFWADRLIASAAPGITTVTCSEGIQLITGADHDHALSNVNPHIWLDPVIGIKIVQRIAAAFTEADPANASFYRKNTAAYILRLEALDRQIAQTVRTFRTKDYVTFHPAWEYFARRYGLRVAGVIEEAPGKEPTPRHVQRILDAVRTMRAKVIFAEPQFSPRIAEAIAQEAGARVLMLDPIGGEKGRETYIDLMKYNLTMMQDAMR
jgi:zinc transport system substrate-binding protein